MKKDLLPFPSDTPQQTRSIVSAEVSILIRLTILIILMLFFSEVCNAQATQTIRSARSGDWSATTTWAGGNIPKAGDNVQLVDGHKITLNGSANCANLELIPPANSDKVDEKTELIVGAAAILTTGILNLNSKNDRRFASLVNNGAAIKAATLLIGKGSIITNTAGSVTISGNITNDGDITTAAALLEIGGTYGGAGIFTAGTGTVNFTGSAAGGQTIVPLSYYHLQLSGNNTKTAVSSLAVSGDLLINAGTTFRAGAYAHTITGDIRNNGTLISETAQASRLTITGDMVNVGTTSAGTATYYISGDWANSGTFQAGTSTIVLQGNTLQQLSGNNTFYNFTFAGTAGGQLLQDITIANSISVNNSYLNTGANTVWLGTNAGFTTLETDQAHVIGTVKTSRTLTTSMPEDFGKIGLTLTRNNIDPGMITVERLTGVTTTIADGTESVTRQYNISRAGINDITALSMTMDLEFLPNELKSKPLNEYKLYNKGQNVSATQVPSSATSQTTMRHTNSNRFGTFTLAPPITPLPVELVWFKANRQEQVVQLQWKTASELNNEGFEVQTSIDGRTFTTIAFIPSKSPNSHVAQVYSYTDSQAKRNQLTYYRLKQVDFSGEVSYSKTAAISAATTPFIVQATPNPFTDYLQFAFEATIVQVTLTDMHGKPVLTKTLTQQDKTQDGYFKLSTSQLEDSGIYVLTLQAPDKLYRTKLLKQ
ncbi:T9SS type A sorting domain-containing protein [Pontibacter fetidus]|uniref:T9SS type A sorting domain-containing protein n=1 Tax=Pontibacter fetidus TaxID=2700082 RepID=A0A6B2H9E2_9BACT|nr:T9SS type A sorting domain-containing protein [Pontibacter fetidus]NDK56770.1 T9SS type A sorting domain-containing protein [Pontibacter fetidus]